MENMEYGLVYAKISNNKDPDKLGRVKVSYDLLGTHIESGWVDVLNLYGGSFYIPDTGANVLVAFCSGDPGKGIVLGGLWAGKQKPPESGENVGSDFNQDGKNSLFFFKTKGGNTIIIDDKAGDAKIQIINEKAKHRIEFLTRSKTIKIKSSKKMLIEGSRNVTLAAKETKLVLKKDLKLEAKTIVVESRDALTLKSGKNVTLDGGPTVKLN